MSPRIYFTLSFGMFTILCAGLTVNWYVTTMTWPWPVHIGFVAFGVGMTLISLLWTVEAVVARYKR